MNTITFLSKIYTLVYRITLNLTHALYSTIRNFHFTLIVGKTTHYSWKTSEKSYLVLLQEKKKEKERNHKGIHFNAEPRKEQYTQERYGEVKQSKQQNEEPTIILFVGTEGKVLNFQIPCLIYETNISTTTKKQTKIHTHKKNSQTAIFKLLREPRRVRFPHTNLLPINLNITYQTFLLYFSKRENQKSSSYTKQLREGK